MASQMTVVTFSLFALVINALMMKFTGSLVKGFGVEGFGTASLAALITALRGVLGFVLLE